MCCGTSLNGKIARAKFCSTKCQTRFNNDSKYKDGTEGYDFIRCPECDQRIADINLRHVQMHGFQSIADFKSHYQLEHTVCESKRSKYKGENNPAYNHGGKFSPWSKNFVNGYDKERHDKFKEHISDVQTNSETNTWSLSYWLKEAEGDEQLAKEMHSKSQTRDLSWFVNKFGEEDGKKRYAAKTEKWLNTMGKKSDEEMQKINEKKVKKSGCFFSKAEKELFTTLKKTFPALTDQKALRRPDTTDKKYYMYDMCLGNKIIEYNGDFWHGNPELYDDTFVNPYTKEPRSVINERDENKLRCAESHGYEVYVVWEHKYKTDPTGVIEECIHFLTK